MTSPALPTTLAEPAARDWDFPRSISGVALLVEYAAEHGLDAPGALAGTGLAPGDLAVADHEVTAGQELQVVRNLLAATGRTASGRTASGEAGSGEAGLADSGLGVEVGSRYHVSTFGIFGFALLSSRTVLDAVNLALRFIDLSFTFGIPRAGIEGDLVRVVVDDHGLPGDVRRFLVERDLAAIHTVLGELVPGGVPLVEAELAFPAPSDASLADSGDLSPYQQVLGVTPRFGAERTTFAFDAAHLARPLPQANPQTVALCEALCHDVVARRRVRSGVTQQVRVLLTQQVAFGGGMDQVAASLGISPRTLRRRLSEAGTSYQALLDEVRQSLAEELLGTRGRGSALTVEDVAQRLGYAEASSFIHAFKRWTGTTPAGFQRAAQCEGQGMGERPRG
ncbi:AraC family transcriptional regulator [Nocardioides pacificus]